MTSERGTLHKLSSTIPGIWSVPSETPRKCVEIQPRASQRTQCVKNHFFLLALANQETQFAWDRAALAWHPSSRPEHSTHPAFLTLGSHSAHTPGLSESGSFEPIVVVWKSACSDNHDAGSTHRHRPRPERPSPFSLQHATARRQACSNKVSSAMRLMWVLLLPDGLGIAISYLSFHLVLLKSRQWEYFASTRFDDDIRANRSTATGRVATTAIAAIGAATAPLP